MEPDAEPTDPDVPAWVPILAQAAERSRRNKQTRRRLPGGGRLFNDGGGRGVCRVHARAQWWRRPQQHVRKWEGGTGEDTPAILAVAEAVRPKLVEDGMFMVGLDIAGDRILEVNVFSPGGLGSSERFSDVDFNGAVIDAVEAKCSLVDSYEGSFVNAQIATF